MSHGGSLEIYGAKGTITAFVPDFGKPQDNFYSD
jgi:hypothetical protein